MASRGFSSKASEPSKQSHQKKNARRRARRGLWRGAPRRRFLSRGGARGCESPEGRPALTCEKVLVTHINNRWLWVSAARLPPPTPPLRPPRRELTDVSLRGLPICRATIPQSVASPPPPPPPPAPTIAGRLPAATPPPRTPSTRSAIHFHGRIAFKCSLGEEWVCRVA